MLDIENNWFEYIDDHITAQTGTIGVVNLQKQYLWIRGQDQQHYFCHFEELSRPSGHLCMLVTGTEVTFTVKPVAGRHPKAAGVQLVHEDRYPTSRVKLTVSQLCRASYIATLACQCEVVVFTADIKDRHRVRLGSRLIADLKMFIDPRTKLESINGYRAEPINLEVEASGSSQCSGSLKEEICKDSVKTVTMH